MVFSWNTPFPGRAGIGIKKQLPTAVKIMVDQSRVVTAYGCWGVIEGGKQVRANIPYFGGIRIKAAHHVLDMLRVEF